jgi:hypothetical protein
MEEVRDKRGAILLFCPGHHTRLFIMNIYNEVNKCCIEKCLRFDYQQQNRVDPIKTISLQCLQYIARFYTRVLQ